MDVLTVGVIYIMSRRIYSRAVHTGRNAEHVTHKDNRYVTCSNCGFICHLDRDIHASRNSRVGDGRTIVDATHYTYDDDIVYDNTAISYDGYSADDISEMAREKSPHLDVCI